jgi:hypothetical protein
MSGCHRRPLAQASSSEQLDTDCGMLRAYGATVSLTSRSIRAMVAFAGETTFSFS